MNSKIQQVCEEILKQIKPDAKEKKEVSNVATNVIDYLNNEIKRLKVDAYPELEGSIAHETWVSGERDIDIFILLSPKYPLNDLKRIGLELGKAASHGKWRERYAEHPFIEATVDSYRVDIVPCYKISTHSERVTSVDRTPLHTEYLSRRLKEKDKNEVILLKAFMKGVGIYGAELKTNGFSGYLCELLTLHYGSFEEVLRNTLRWVTPQVIDIEKHYSEQETPKKIFSEPLIVVDPIDPARNVAAAVSLDRIADLKAATRAFIANPSTKFFKPSAVKPLTTKELSDLTKNRKTDTLFVLLPCQKISPDIIWGELRRSTRALKKLLELNDFEVISHDSWSDEEKDAIIVIELASDNLPAVKVHEGPAAGDPNQEKFIEKHLHHEKTLAGPWIKDGKWQVELKREYRNAKQLIEAKLKGENLGEIGISKDIAKWVKEGGKVVLNEGILPFYSANSGFAEFLTEFYRKQTAWLI
nr:CCA tRNA nucleotidyltransferase [Candidatus Njordarchaeum guaymaensis]